MSDQSPTIVRQPRRMLAELRRDVDRYRDALVRLAVTCEQTAQPMPDGLVGYVDQEQYAAAQMARVAEAAKEARAVVEEPGWVARMCDPDNNQRSQP